MQRLGRRRKYSTATSVVRESSAVSDAFNGARGRNDRGTPGKTAEPSKRIVVALDCRVAKLRLRCATATYGVLQL